MLDDGVGVSTAVREILEETGIRVEGGDLVDLGSAYPSPGACDEEVGLYACEKYVTEEELERVKDRLGGLSDELITVRLVRVCDLWRQTTDRMLEDLVLDTTCVVTTAKTFKALADQCQDPSTRTHLTQHPSNLSQTLCTVLQRTLNDLRQLSSSESSRADDVFLLIQTLRCMGNLSADNNDARAQLLEHGGVASIGSVLGVAEAQSEPLLTRAAFGAALNVALDHAECSKALLAAGALHSHLQVLGTGVPSDVWPIVCMSLDNLCEHDDAAA
ncbi:hypothetical protein H4S03_009633, partial [Coemansia sp. S3946]